MNLHKQYRHSKKMSHLCESLLEYYRNLFQYKDTLAAAAALELELALALEA